MKKIQSNLIAIALIALASIITGCSVDTSKNQSQQVTEKQSLETDERYLDYPIEYTDNSINPFSSFVRKPTPRILFESGYLLNTAGDNGSSFYCVLDKKTILDDTVHYFFSLNVKRPDNTTGKMKTEVVMLAQIKIRADHNDKCNYMTYIRYKNNLDGMFEEHEFNEFNPIESYGTISGTFAGLSKFMLDVDKINEVLTKN